MAKIAFIARADNSGLGTLSREFARHLKPVKVLIVQNGVYQVFPERYSDFPNRIVPSNKTMSQEDKDWLLDGADVLLTLETFYDWGIIKDCRARGVKTALYTMFEMTRAELPMHPDLFICPSKLDVEYFKEYNHVFLPPPIATDRIIWKKRERANHFIHVASHGGINLRKGTIDLLDAMKLVKSDIKMTIYTWRDFTCDDLRVEIKKVEFKNYWQLWREGDVLVYPQGANGIALPVIEAMSSGMAVLTTDAFPFNEYVPKDLLFKPERSYKTVIFTGLMEVEDYVMSPKNIAEKIDFIAGKDITEYSEYGRKWAEENSWDKLLPKYNEALNSL